jgi:hypothetical protein
MKVPKVKCWGGFMKKLKILSKPTRYSDLSLDDLYDQEDMREIKAEKIRVRAMRKFKHQMY